MTMNKDSKKTKTTTPDATTRTIASFALLTASVLVVSSFAATQLTASNAYAQSTATVTGRCKIEEPPDGGNLNLFTTFDIGALDRGSYYYQILDSSGKELYLSQFEIFVPGEDGGGLTFPAVPGETYTFNLYQDSNNDFSTVGVEQGELIANKTVTCQDYTDLFSNRGQCIKFAKTNPGGVITKSGCQEEF
ncbi:MAG TPA: hypothetical protein VGE97_03730 [Nitrososphaera sp.]